jgi:hypothetical protein
MINDGFTKWAEENLNVFSERIYDIDDGLYTIENSEGDIIEYLKGIRCSMSLGMALRRYFCTKFGKKTENGYIFVLHDGRKINVGKYLRDNYDIENDDIKEYTELFCEIHQEYNPEVAVPGLTKAEARRLLRLNSSCQRKKMFEISFALHVNPDEMNKFLTDVLAEQTYNYRDPYEIIAYFCHSHEDRNSYKGYLALSGEYIDELLPNGNEQRKNNYTSFATQEVQNNINSEEELFAYLRKNQADFSGCSQTAYKEFRMMYDKACEESRYQRYSNDDYLHNVVFNSEKERIEYQDRVNYSVGFNRIENSPVLAKQLGVDFIGNPEQLAHTMLEFVIPRASFEKTQKGQRVVSSDFISISNGEQGQKAKKKRTTKMPKDITMNLLMRDRLDDLLLQKKSIERKDLVFLKFYLFSLHIFNKGLYTGIDYVNFRDECDDMLLRCGMSRLYFANRFENLILLSLLSEDPLLIMAHL